MRSTDHDKTSTLSYKQRIVKLNAGFIHLMSPFHFIHGNGNDTMPGNEKNVPYIHSTSRNEFLLCCWQIPLRIVSTNCAAQISKSS